MNSLIAGSILVSIVHAIFPNHWLPVVVVSKVEKWPVSKALTITAYLAFLHILSTAIIGMLLFILGNQLEQSGFAFLNTFTGVAFILFGVVYFLMDRWRKPKPPGTQPRQASSGQVVTYYLAGTMLLSPCLEIAPFYFGASQLGWSAFAAVTIAYGSISLIGVVLMVYTGISLLKKIEHNFLHRHEKAILAAIFVLIGIFMLFAE